MTRLIKASFQPIQHSRFGGASASIIELDEGGGATKVAEYRNLVEKRNVNAVVGYISSGNCQALAPIAEELKQFTIFATCGPGILRRPQESMCSERWLMRPLTTPQLRCMSRSNSLT